MTGYWIDITISGWPVAVLLISPVVLLAGLILTSWFGQGDERTPVRGSADA